MHLVTTFLLFLLLTVPVHASEHKPTHCDDPAVWMPWQKTATPQTSTLNFHTLHALGQGLCMTVKNGGLTEDEANSVFEHAPETRSVTLPTRSVLHSLSPLFSAQSVPVIYMTISTKEEGSWSPTARASRTTASTTLNE